MPAAVLVAATRNAALAVDRPGLRSLQKGMPGDLAIVNAPAHVHVPYTFGVNLVETVVKGGEVVYEDDGGVRS